MTEINMSSTSGTFLRKNFPEFFNFEDLDSALLALDSYITYHGFDENDEPTAFGREAEAVYDEIYMCN